MSKFDIPTKIELPEFVFVNEDAETQIATEQETMTPVDRLSWDKGIFLYLQGAEYPQKGMTSPETMWALNMVKRNFIEAVKIFGSKEFVPTAIIFSLYSHKAKLKFIEKLLSSFNRQSWGIMSPYILKNEYLTPVAQELCWISYSFLINLGISTGNADRFSLIFSHMVEYDRAYQFRILDIFSETNKSKLLANPIKEIKRLIRLMAERDSHEVHMKFKLVGLGLSFMLFFRKFRKAFKIAVSEVDVRKLSYDDGDRYWACVRSDYKYMGKTNEERREMIKDKSLPALEKIKWQKS
jgi:hypothetical protein